MKKVILSQKTYLSMLTEVYERIETETGGIFLGHREGDIWYVLESIEPGPQSIFKKTYFEYDNAYVNYRANKVSRLYKCSVELLGLWHRHPSLMKTFSSTDDGTNKTYSDMLGGAISGIVTLGNGFEITMYYVPPNVQYEKIEWIVDDKQIPSDYLKYYDTEYYEHLINETAEKQYGTRFGEHEQNDIESSSNSVDKIHKKGILSSIIGKATEMIYDIFDIVEESKDQVKDAEYSNIDDEDNDIAYIFDIIEPEIAYLQQFEKEGKIQSTIEKKKNRNGKEGLILNILDLRQIDQYVYRLTFFVNKNKIWVKDEEGNARPYSENFIDTILGGKR